MGKFFGGTNKIFVVLLAVIIAAAGLGSCSKIQDVTEVISQDLPTADNTLTSLLDINRAMNDAMSQGETELTFNATGVSEDELRNIGNNLSTFWGKPVRYTINNEFENIEGIVPGQAVTVQNITNSFELSNNYYVYDYIRNGTPIPDDKPNAKEIANVLPGIAARIFTDPEATDYEKTLAAHDWIVANIDYDDTIPGIGLENSSYGALVQKRTMCQGYAEALELLLRCYTNIETEQIVGEALNYTNEDLSADSSDESGTDVTTDANANPTGDAGGTAGADSSDGSGGDGAVQPSGDWGGHAWNAVKIDGAWYQIDPTFNDPKDNPSGQISHFYFGQTDEVMSANHRWANDYFPVSDTQNFLYFRQSGLFADDWDSFQSILTGMLEESPVPSLEIAVQGATIDENNIQFIYKVRKDLEMIRWSEQVWNDVHVQSIELYYS